MTEYAWVVEQGSTEEPLYYAPQTSEGWSKDHLQAVRFSRQQDAQIIVDAYAVDDEIDVRILEHGWG